jgi:ATP-dependent DNA helicase PIF1
MNSRTVTPVGKFIGTRLFGRKNDVESFNLQKLNELPSKSFGIRTTYTAHNQFTAKTALPAFKKQCPIPETLYLKEGAVVMLRKNCPNGRFVNGSMGVVVGVYADLLRVELLDGERVDLLKEDFTMLDASSKPSVTAVNFPVTLAYAMTIHKTQGATLDKILLNADDLWEVGQLYVALSRVKTPDGVFIEKWSPESILADRKVMEFYDSM